MQYRFFIGVDVSKEHLDVALLEAGQIKTCIQIENQPKAIVTALKQLTTA